MVAALAGVLAVDLTPDQFAVVILFGAIGLGFLIWLVHR